MICKKAQSAIEFMILVGMVLFVFTLLSFVFYSAIHDRQYTKRNILVDDIALTVKEEIAIAHSVRDGYSRTFSLPESVLGQDYDISIEEGYVRVITLDGEHSLAYPVLNVTGMPLKGDNIIRKQNNRVYLN